MSPVKSTLTLHAPSDPDCLLRAAVTDALRGVAHALRGPLANLMILFELAEALRRAPAGQPGGTEALMRSMIGQIRTAGDALGYAEALVDIADVVAGAAAVGRPLASSRSVSVRHDHTAPFCILGDGGLLAQAVDAMLDAAISRSARNGEVRLALDRDDPAVSITVRFTPSGPPLLRQHAADPLNARHLWLARLIAIRHGGELTCPGLRQGHERLVLMLPASVR